MPQEPFRLRVLKALTTTLEGISIVDGYRHDMAGRVFRGRSLFGPKDPIPMISILEAPIPLEVIKSQGGNPNSSGPWELLIQGFSKDDPKNPTDPAHLLMADVKAILAKEKLNRNDRQPNMFGMDGRVMEMGIGQGSVRPADEVSVKAFFWLTLTLRLAEPLDKPYD